MERRPPGVSGADGWEGNGTVGYVRIRPPLRPLLWVGLRFIYIALGLRLTIGDVELGF